MTTETEAARKERAAHWRRQLEQDLRAILMTGEGRRFIFDLVFRRCGALRRSQHGPEGLRREGRRDLAADLIDDMNNHFPDLWFQTQTEGNKALAEEATKQRDQKARGENDT